MWVGVCRIVRDLVISTMRSQLVHCTAHKNIVAWWFYVTGYLAKPSKGHIKIIYLLTAVWCTVCSLPVSECCISELLSFVLHNMCIPKSHIIMKCISHIVIIFVSHSLFAIRYSEYSYSTTGLANFNPQESSIICQGLACGPQLCIIPVPKTGGIELSRRPLFTKYKLR